MLQNPFLARKPGVAVSGWDFWASLVSRTLGIYPQSGWMNPLAANSEATQIMNPSRAVLILCSPRLSQPVNEMSFDQPQAAPAQEAPKVHRSFPPPVPKALSVCAFSGETGRPSGSHVHQIHSHESRVAHRSSRLFLEAKTGSDIRRYPLPWIAHPREHVSGQIPFGLSPEFNGSELLHSLGWETRLLR